MDSIIKLSTLSEIKPYKSGWRVAVKVIHKWVSFSHQFGACLEMVLADKNGVKIHAICKQKLMQRFENQCGVGEWKIITNFALSAASGMNRPSNHVYKIEFMIQTSITDCNFTCDDNMFLDLHDFSTIIDGLRDNRFLIDVIGVILDFGANNIVQGARKEVIKVAFTLGDINNHHLKCCISGRLAELLIQDAKPKNGDICLIRFAKIFKYDDYWRVSNTFNSTLVFINPAIKDAQALKQKFHVDVIVLDKNNNICDKLQINEKRLKWSQFRFLTIKEMKRSEKDGNCRLICSVYAIDTSDGWWYCACVVCESKVIKPRIVFGESDVPNWWCEICQHNVTKVSPRYKFDLLVQDQTGETKFSLPDSAATYFVFFFDNERLIYYSSLSWSGEPDRNRTTNVVHIPMKGSCYLSQRIRRYIFRTRNVNK